MSDLLWFCISNKYVMCGLELVTSTWSTSCYESYGLTNEIPFEQLEVALSTRCFPPGKRPARKTTHTHSRMTVSNANSHYTSNQVQVPLAIVVKQPLHVALEWDGETCHNVLSLWTMHVDLEWDSDIMS